MTLFREIGLAGSTFLVIGNIIGIGIFTTSGLIAEQLGNSFWLVGIWILGGLVALVGAICYSLLGIQFPRAGGEYAFLRPTFGPFAAFLAGWASLFIGFTAPIAASALGLSYYLRPYFPVNLGSSDWALKGVAILALLAVSFFLSLGLRMGSSLHSTVTFLNFVLIVGFALAALFRSPGSQNLAPILEGGLSQVHLPSLASAFILVMFTYSGWNAAAYIAEEIRSPGRNIPGALILGTVAVIFVYCLVNLAYFSISPLAALQGEVAVAEITAQTAFGAVGKNLVSILIIVSILSSLTAMSIAGPRVYFAMSRDGLFPRWLSEVHATKKVPLKAIWFQTLMAILLVSVGSFYEILLYSGFILILFSTLTVATLLKTSQWRILPLLFVLVNTVILVNAVISNPKETFAGLVTVALGIPVFLYYRAAAKT